MPGKMDELGMPFQGGGLVSFRFRMELGVQFLPYWRGKTRRPNHEGWARKKTKTESDYPTFHLDDFVGLRSFLALDDLKLDGIAFLQGLEAFTLNGRVVNEDVSSALLADEAVTLGIIEPLHFTLQCCHLRSSLMCFGVAGSSVGPKKKKPRIAGDPRHSLHVRVPDANTVQTPICIHI